jgi:hypothetical protein
VQISGAGSYFPDEQIRYAIAELRREFPDAWPRIKDVMRNSDDSNDEKIGMNASEMYRAFGRLPLVAESTDPPKAMRQLIHDVFAVAAEEIASE